MHIKWSCFDTETRRTKNAIRNILNQDGLAGNAREGGVGEDRKRKIVDIKGQRLWDKTCTFSSSLLFRPMR